MLQVGSVFVVDEPPEIVIERPLETSPCSVSQRLIFKIDDRIEGLDLSSHRHVVAGGFFTC